MIGLRCLMAARMILELKGFLATISMSPTVVTSIPVQNMTVDNNPTGDYRFYSRPNTTSRVPTDEWIDVAWRAESPEARPIDTRPNSMIDGYEMTPRGISYGVLPEVEDSMDDHLASPGTDRIAWSSSPGTSTSMLPSPSRVARPEIGSRQTSRSRWS